MLQNCNNNTAWLFHKFSNNFPLFYGFVISPKGHNCHLFDVVSALERSTEKV